MDKVTIATPNKNYNIYFEKDFNSLTTYLKENNLENRKVCIVTDSNVDRFYGEEVLNKLKAEYQEVSKFVFPAGEENKNLDTIKNMYEFFVQNKLDRKSVLIALGGGVTGDMTGFAASSYMRGIHYIQVPTSLLSQVDSSVGGKTGVDFMTHKNIVGAFYQPDFVYVNVSSLSTLPKEQFSSGMAEAIKHGLILDREYYDFMIENVENIKALKPEFITKLVSRSCKLKSYIVNQDEKEKGLREVLNFGHTVGHAVESLYDFKKLHGECVALGMVAAGYMSMKEGYISQNDLDSIKNTILKYDLPIKIENLDSEKIYNQLFYDKKVKNNILQFVLLNKIGDTIRTNELSKDVIIDSIKYCL